MVDMVGGEVMEDCASVLTHVTVVIENDQGSNGSPLFTFRLAITPHSPAST